MTELQDSLKAINLGQETEKRVVLDYQSTADTNNLIKDYQEQLQVMTVTSSFFSRLWKTPVSEEEKRLMSDKLLYLTQLQKLDQLQSEIDSLTPQEANVSHAGPVVFNQETLCKMIDEAVAPLALKTSPLIDFADEQSTLNTVIRFLPLIADQVEHLNELTPIVNKLIGIESQILALLTQTGFMGNDAELAPDDETLKKLERTATKRTTDLANIDLYVKHCDDFLEHMGEYLASNPQPESCVRKPKNRKPKKHSAQRESESLRPLETSILLLITQLCSTAESKELTVPVEQQADTKPSPTKPDRSEFFKLLNACHSCSFKLSSLKSWYKSLADTLTANLHTNPSLYLQILQLLHDIHNELESAVDENSLFVLPAYQSLCPNPSSDWRTLVSLKLAVTPQSYWPGDLQTSTLHQAIEVLYAYAEKKFTCKHLMKQTLLFQATRNLHHLAFIAERNPEQLHEVLTNIRFWRHDPHYSLLMEHRGFYIVCEYLAKLITGCFKQITGQMDLDYRDSFFFKRTTSHQLMDQCATEILARDVLTSRQ